MDFTSNDVVSQQQRQEQNLLMDSVLCFLGSKLIRSGLNLKNSRLEAEAYVASVNAGGGAVKGRREETEVAEVVIGGDSCFRGGDVLRTDEIIVNGGDLPSVYQTARFGDFCYEFNGLEAGEYSVDLHFAEIVNTNGPKGMRVFDVFIQGEKVICELDIYAIVGANKALQVVDVGVCVGGEGVILISFEGVVGSPIVSGICIKKQAPDLTTSLAKHHYLVCQNCATEVKMPSAQNKEMRMETMTRYEKKIKELKGQCQVKADECYEAWMSLKAANQELEKVRMELDNVVFQNMSLDHAMEKRTAELREISSQYEVDKRRWVAAICELESKVKMMKIEHAQLSHVAHDCANSIPELNKMVFAVQALVTQYDDLKQKFNEEQETRKKLYNRVQEAKGNIRVFCRCRPLSKEEASAGYQTVLDFAAAKDGDLGIITSESAKKIFKFDRVYTPKDDQVDVFADASSMVISVLDGFNVCIFAYGQTGTGKTFTMEGIEENRGVNYRTLEQLFKAAEERKETFVYDISVSALEVYNEQFRDLLANAPPAKRLEIKQVSEGVHHVPGIIEAKVKNIKEAWDVLQAGSNARAVGSNNVNEHSSRSHWNSKLTHLLQDSLGGDSKTLMFVQISPSENDLGETLSSLNFATRVRRVELGLPKKQIDNGELQKLKIMLDKARQELRLKDDAMHELQQSFQILESKAKSKDQLSKNQKQQVYELENLLASKTQLCRQLEDQLLQFSEEMKGKEAICSNFQHKVKVLEERMKERTSEFELNSQALQQKIKELEYELAKRRDNEESQLLQRKIKVIEENPRQHEPAGHCMPSPAEKLGVTPTEAQVLRPEFEPLSRRSFNSSIRTSSQESILLRGTDSLRELRRKRGIQSKGTENNLLLSTSLLEKKILSAAPNRTRHLDSSRALARITRSTKPVGASQNAHSNTNNRDQDKLKIWLR